MAEVASYFRERGESLLRLRTAILLSTFGCFCVCALLSCEPRSPSKPVSITVGAPALVQNALLYVAKAEHLYARNGLSVSIRDFQTGPAAIAAMMSGSIDIAETAEFPFVESVMGGAKMRIIATNDVFENDYLVVRKDRGIASPADLRGKRIGVDFGTVTQFYLSRYLALHGIVQRRVEEVDVAPADFVQAILDGRVDAVVAWESYVRHMVAARPGAFAVWPVQSNQAVYGILVGRSGWIEKHAKAVASFLRALAAARLFLDDHSGRSKALVARRLGDGVSYVSRAWRNHDLSLTLDFSLVAAMQEEARWMIANHLASTDPAPDFARYIYPAALRVVRPDGVNLMQ